MRLFWVYVAVWFFPLNSAIWYVSGYNVGLSNLAKSYMIGLIAMLGVLSILFSIIFRNKPPKEILIARFNESKSINFHTKCLQVWFTIFAIEVVISGGAPIIWAGTDKSYGDFGLPVVHGFSNMLRAMIFSNIVLFKYLNFKLSRRMIILSCLPLISALIIEQSRGAFVMTMCFALGPMLLFSKISLIKIIKSLIIIPLLVIVLSVFQFLRYADSAIDELNMISEYVVDSDTAYEKLLEPVFNYIATPALNAGLNIDASPVFNFYPNETIKPVIPSPLRPIIWDMSLDTKDDWGLLVNEAFNTASFITPFVRDFGLFGSVLFFAWFFFLCTYVYHRARCGSIVDVVRLSPLVMCIALSFFTTYISSLVTILYLVLAKPVSKRMMY